MSHTFNVIAPSTSPEALSAGLFELSARRYEAGPVVVQYCETTGPATALMYQGLHGLWSTGPVKHIKNISGKNKSYPSHACYLFITIFLLTFL